MSKSNAVVNQGMVKATYSKDDIKVLLEKNDRAVMKGIVNIFQLQTQDEQDYDCTKEHNGVGFNGVDAEILSSFAKQIMERGSLSTKQMAIARKKIVRYAGQLAKIANGELTVPKIDIPFKDKKVAQASQKGITTDSKVVATMVNTKRYMYVKGDKKLWFMARDLDSAEKMVRAKFGDEGYFGCVIYEINEKQEAVTGGDLRVVPSKEYFVDDDIVVTPIF